jgi:hypothetical protein
MEVSTGSSSGLTSLTMISPAARSTVVETLIEAGLGVVQDLFAVDVAADAARTVLDLQIVPFSAADRTGTIDDDRSPVAPDESFDGVAGVLPAAHVPPVAAVAVAVGAEANEEPLGAAGLAGPHGVRDRFAGKDLRPRLIAGVALASV